MRTRALGELAAHHGIALVDDIGSGVLAHGPGPVAGLLASEPAAADSVAAGASVVCFSADKLLGGPQAGIAAGTAAALAAMRTHPLARAVRIDKLSLTALEATLRLHLEPARAAGEVPVLQMLAADEQDLLAAAVRLHDGIAAGAPAGTTVRVVRALARAGGGSLPLAELEARRLPSRRPPAPMRWPRSCAAVTRDRGARARGRGAPRSAHDRRRRGRVRRARRMRGPARARMTPAR